MKALSSVAARQLRSGDLVYNVVELNSREPWKVESVRISGTEIDVKLSRGFFGRMTATEFLFNCGAIAVADKEYREIVSRR